MIAQTNEVQITASNTWLYGNLQSPLTLQANVPYWVAIEANGVNKVLYWSENGAYPNEPACGVSYNTTLPNSYPSCSLTSAYFYTSVVAGSLTFTNGQNSSLPNGNYPVTGNSAPGYSFSAWSRTGGVSVSSSSNPTTTATVTAPGSITASFTQISVTFDTNPSSFVGASTPGSIGACSGTFTNGQSSTNCGGGFSAMANLPSPSTGWSFSNWVWTGGVSCSSSSANPTSCTVSSSGSLQAVFLAQITFNTNPTTAGSINWDSCSGTGYTNTQTLVSSNFGANAVCYVPSGYTFSSWSCTGGLSCPASTDPTTASFTGPGTITLTLKTGSIPSPAQTNITAIPSNATPTRGTMFTVSGTLRLVSTGVGIGSEPIECVFSWSTNIVTVTTQTGETLGNYTCTVTAPNTTGPYNVDAFFLGDYTHGNPQYLPSKATAMITVT